MYRSLVICTVLVAALACGGSDYGGPTGPTSSFLGCATVQTIAVGANVNGSLATSDCQLQGAFVDYYELGLNSGTNITINLASNDFDAFLFVFDRTSGNLVAEDDDSGGNLNSRITQFFAAGTYIVAATSFDPNDTGQYTLAIN